MPRSRGITPDPHPTLDPDRFTTEAFEQALELIHAQEQIERVCMKQGFVSGERVA